MALEGYDLHMAIVTPAQLDEDGGLDLMDEAVLNTICEEVAHPERGINARSILFISEGSLAAIETAHHMSEAFCRRRCSTKRFAPERNFWMRRTAQDVIVDLCRREMFAADLWVFVGNVRHLLAIIKLLIPHEYRQLDRFDPDDVPPASFLGFSVMRDSFFEHAPTVGRQQ